MMKNIASKTSNLALEKITSSTRECQKSNADRYLGEKYVGQYISIK